MRDAPDKTSTSGSPAPDIAKVPPTPPNWGGTDATNSMDSKDAFWTNITPKHEPWHRTFNGLKDEKELFTHDQEFDAESPKVARDNKQNPTNNHERGTMWHR